MQIQSSAIIEKYFGDSDLPDEGYNNQDFYMGSANRMRYLLVTLPLSPEGDQWELGQEENRFYGCIEFQDNGFSIKKDSLLKELIAMTEDELTDYIVKNEYDWLGDDYDHIHQYLNFVSAWQDEWQFWGEDMDRDDYMTIARERWLVDRKAGVKSTNPYEIAYNVLAEYWDYLPDDEKTDINKRLEKVGI